MDEETAEIAAHAGTTMNRLLRLRRELLTLNEQLRASLGPSEGAARAAADELHARGLDLLPRHERLAEALRGTVRRGRSATGG